MVFVSLDFQNSNFVHGFEVFEFNVLFEFETEVSNPYNGSEDVMLSGSDFETFFSFPYDVSMGVGSYGCVVCCICMGWIHLGFEL